MAPDGHQQFRVLDTHLVTPASTAVPCSLPLTFFDVKWLHLPPVERVFLYRLPQDADADSILSSLKDSLSHALQAFYPLAGRVRLVPGTANRHELLFQPGDGVVFTTAEYDVDVDDLVASPDGGEPVPVSRLAPLVPRLPDGRSVLAVQATLLRRGGLAVGVTVHHSACDGNSSMHFLRTWAKACAGSGAEAPPPPPVIDRTLIPDPRGLYDTYLERMPPGTRCHDFEFVGKAPSAAGADDDDTRLIATFTLSEEVLQTIRSGYASARAPTAPSRCSSLVAACGFMWWCHSRATPPSSDNNNKKKKLRYFLLSVDQRARLNPPVPAEYFGNCLCPAIATAAQDEVAGAGAGSGEGLYAACAAVAAAVEEEVGEGARERWGVCMERVREAVVNGTLSVAGSPRFRVYDIDFGFGRPAKVDIVSVAKTGAISVAEARGGGRGMEVGVSLPPPAMERFRACFTDGIAWLRRGQ